jgi:hypothetical protein
MLYSCALAKDKEKSRKKKNKLNTNKDCFILKHLLNTNKKWGEAPAAIG